MSFVNKGANILFFFNMPFGTKKILIFFLDKSMKVNIIYKTKLLWPDNNRRQTYDNGKRSKQTGRRISKEDD